MNAITPPDAEARAGFRRMQEGTAEDWAKIAGSFRGYARALPDRILDHLKSKDATSIDPSLHQLICMRRFWEAMKFQQYLWRLIVCNLGRVEVG